MLPGIIYLILVTTIVYKKSQTVVIKLALSLSLISFIVPASGGYLLGWVTILALYILSDFAKSELALLSRKQIVLLIAIICTLCTPGFVFYGGIVGFSRHIPIAPLLILLIPLLIATILFEKSISTKNIGKQ
jgi:hypothetical protein